MKNEELLKKITNNFNVRASDKESVLATEKKLHVKFPEALFSFFLYVGDDYEELFDGVGACKLSQLEYNLNLANDLLKKRGVSFNKKFIPFVSHGADQFLFIYLDDGQDPAVYHFETELYLCGDDYIQGSSSWGYPKGVSKVADSFTKLLEDILSEE